MIVYLTKERYRDPPKLFLETLGSRLAKKFKLLTYDALSRTRKLPVGTYIFADLERLTSRETERAVHIYNALKGSGRDLRLLNHPARSMRRFELLRHLHAAGINDFNVYRLADTRSEMRFPVFIRAEDNHCGSLTPLLRTEAELDATIGELVAKGASRENKLIVEFTDVSDGREWYPLNNAFLIGNRIIASDHELSSNWVNKGYNFIAGADWPEDMEQDYAYRNPHEKQLRRIFEIARIDYGRIDYAAVGDQLRVFEINTNPTIIDLMHFIEPQYHAEVTFVAGKLAEGFEAIDHPAGPSCAIRTRPYRDPSSRSWTYGLRMAVHDCLRTLHLLKFEPIIMAGMQVLRGRFVKPTPENYGLEGSASTAPVPSPKDVRTNDGSASQIKAP